MPAPTPYDITPIPFFAFEPGLYLWVLAIILIILSIFLVRRLKKNKKPVSKATAISVAQRSIEKLDSSAGADLRLSFILRRLTSHLTGLPFLSLTAVEISEISRSEGSKNKQALFELICQLESSRYSGEKDGSFEKSRSRALEIIRSLKEQELK